MSDKHEPAKHEPAKVPHATDKHEPARAPHAPTKDKDDAPKGSEHKELEAQVPHRQAVEEGIKAAESHRQTTEDVVEAGREPVKAPPPHPFVGKMTKLRDQVADLAKKHKQEVLDLREQLQKTLFEVPNDIPGHSLHSVHSVATQIEEGINMLDPDCSAKAPG
jgi:hypothetical protein